LFTSEEFQKFYEFGKKLMDMDGNMGFGSVNLEKKLMVQLPVSFYFFSNLFSFITLAFVIALFPFGASLYWAFPLDGERDVRSQKQLPYNPTFILAGTLIFVLTRIVYSFFSAVFIVAVYLIIAIAQERYGLIKKNKCPDLIANNIFGVAFPAIVAIILLYFFWTPRSQVLVTEASLSSVRYRKLHGMDKRTLDEAIFHLKIRNQGKIPVYGITISSEKSILHLNSISIQPGETKTSNFSMSIDSYPNHVDLSVGAINHYYPLTTRVYIPESIYEIANQLTNSRAIKNILVEGATGSGKTTFIGDVCGAYRNNNNECRVFVSGRSSEHLSRQYAQLVISSSGIDSFALIDKYGLTGIASNASNIEEEHLTAVLSGYSKQKGSIDIDISTQLDKKELNTYLERVKKLTPEFVLKECGLDSKKFSLQCIAILNEVVSFLENQIHGVIVVVKENDSRMFQAVGRYGKRMERFIAMNLNPYFVITHVDSLIEDQIFEKFEKEQVSTFSRTKALIPCYCSDLQETDAKYKSCKEKQKDQILKFMGKVLSTTEERYVFLVEKYFRELRPTILKMMKDYDDLRYSTPPPKESRLLSVFAVLLIALAFIKMIMQVKVDKNKVSKDSTDDIKKGSTD
jgi:hypothetical protein